MKHAIYYEPNGKIVRGRGVPFGEPAAIDGYDVLLLDEQIDITAHYVKDGEVLAMPPRPGEHYEFIYENEAWVLNQEAFEVAIRDERNARLAASDWTQLPDVPLETKQAWATYRQALRDITEQEGFPESIEWPTPPA